MKQIQSRIAIFAASGSVRCTIREEKGFPASMEYLFAQTNRVAVSSTPLFSSMKSWTWVLDAGLNEVGTPCMIMGYTLLFRTSWGLILQTQRSDGRARTALRIDGSFR